MEANSFRLKILSSLFWKFCEQGSIQIITFVVGIILARLLLPEDFGAIALITVFIAFSNIIIEGGFGTALVQKKEVNNSDYSSVFYLSLTCAAVCYAILFLISPVIAEFYNISYLTTVLRVLGITVFFGAVNSVQKAYVQRNFLFRPLFICSLASVIISGSVGIALAFAGFGVWALVGQQLLTTIVLCITLLSIVKWRPSLEFSISRTKSLFSYGGKLLVSNIISTAYTQIQPLFIGRVYAPDMLGYYTRGQSFPQLISGTIVNNVIQTVLFPAFSENQEKPEIIKGVMQRSLKTCSFFLFPALFGMAAVASPFISLVLTDKWLFSVPFLQIFCIYYLFWPIHTVNNQATLSLGRSDIYLRNQIICLIITIALLVITINISLYAVAFGAIITTIIGTAFIMYPNKKLVGYSIRKQLHDLFPPFILSAIMGIAVYSITFVNLPTILILAIQVVLGVFIYFTLAYIFKVEAFQYILGIVREYFPSLKRE